MKAILINKYGGSEVLEYAEIPKPIPGPDEILIQTKYAAVNPADWKVRNGKLKMITGKKFPKILGIEASGVVEEVGENVHNFKKGQAVFAAKDYTTGTYAEYFKISKDNVLLLPESMSFEEAASIAVTGVTAYQSLVHHGKMEEEMNVLVNGASGGVGIMAVQIAKFLKANVTGICSTRNIEFVQSLGADKVLDYTKEDYTKRNESYDIILDCAGNADLKKVKNQLSQKGILIKLNLSAKTMLDQAISSLCGQKKVKLVLLKRNIEDFKWVRDQIALKNLKVFTDKVFNLSDCSKAHNLSESLRARGKILLKP